MGTRGILQRERLRYERLERPFPDQVGAAAQDLTLVVARVG